MATALRSSPFAGSIQDRAHSNKNLSFNFTNHLLKSNCNAANVQTASVRGIRSNHSFWINRIVPICRSQSLLLLLLLLLMMRFSEHKQICCVYARIANAPVSIVESERLYLCGAHCLIILTFLFELLA